MDCAGPSQLSIRDVNSVVPLLGPSGLPKDDESRRSPYPLFAYQLGAHG